MANIKKTFNFRNGVQVDEKNLIVNSLGLVGIGTTVPTELLDVQGNVKSVGFVTATTLFGKQLVAGISTLSSGSIGKLSASATGIITATSGIVTYYGDGRFLLGLPTSQWLDVDSGLGFTSIYSQGYVGIATNMPIFPLQIGGSLSLNNFRGVGINSEGSIFASGIITASRFIGTHFGDGSNLSSLDASNITLGSLNLDRLPQLTNSKLPNNISVSGIITASQGFSGNLTGNVTGNLVGIANTASSITPNINITVNNLQSNFSNIGVTTTTNLFVNGTIGINTSNPQGNLHVVSSSSGTIRLSSQNTSLFVFGKGLNTTNVAGFRYGNESGLTPYSNTNSLDIINYDVGNVNNYIQLNSPSGLGTGNFNWFWGKNPFTPTMTLTYDGNLGIGITNPRRRLEVVGTSTFVGSAYFSDNVFISGSATINNTLTVSSLVVPSVNTLLLGNVYTQTGISTFNDVSIGSTIYANRTLINGTVISNQNNILEINDIPQNSFVVTSSGTVGVKTDVAKFYDLDASNALSVFKAVGVGTTNLRSAVDFADAGKGIFSDLGRFILPPRMTTTERDAMTTGLTNAGLIANLAGAIIYNTTVARHQGYNGAWNNLY